MALHGVRINELKTHADDRGYFREIFPLSGSSLSSCAQISATMSYSGVIKAFHYHAKQDDLWYCSQGMILAVLYDRRETSQTYRETQVVPMGDHAQVSLYIPHGIAHGYKVLGGNPAIVVYATSHVYNPKDEFRIPYDDPEIGFDWMVKPR